MLQAFRTIKLRFFCESASLIGNWRCCTIQENFYEKSNKTCAYSPMPPHGNVFDLMSTVAFWNLILQNLEEIRLSSAKEIHSKTGAHSVTRGLFIEIVRHKEMTAYRQPVGDTS